MRFPLLAGLLAAALTSPLVAQTAPQAWKPTLRSILEPAGPEGRQAPALGMLETLATLEKVRLSELEIPGLPGAVLDLERVRAFHAGSRVSAEGGDPVPTQAAVGKRYSTFGGEVEGHPESRVFLAFSELGARGWIYVDGRTIHLLPEREGPGPVLASRFIDNEEIADHFPAERAQCDMRTEDGRAPQPPVVPPVAGYSGDAFDPLMILELVIETDADYRSNFSSTSAATQYALDLAAAISSTYETDTGIQVIVSQLNVYNNSTDPYDGTDPGSLLDEIQDRWQNTGLIGQGDAALVLSDHPGGGVAYLNTLCGGNGVGACCGVSGDTPLPLFQSPSNWDYVVTAHELGHIVATSHTHNYCPPIDQCPPSQYFGQCQNNQICQQGTIMSYCHLCSGGINNIAPAFHPQVASVMRNGALGRPCIEKIFQSDFCAQTQPEGITEVIPTTVPVLVPDGPQVLLVEGCGFNDVFEIRIGGQALSSFPPQWYYSSNTEIVVNLPNLPGIGQQTMELVTPNETFSYDLTAELTSTPILDVENSAPSFIVQLAGMTAHVSGDPNDAAVLFASADSNPTSLPGIIEAGLGGNNLDSVFILGVQLIDPATGLTTFQVPMQGLDTGFTFYTQAGLLKASNPVFPLVTTNVQISTVLF